MTSRRVGLGAGDPWDVTSGTQAEAEPCPPSFEEPSTEEVRELPPEALEDWLEAERRHAQEEAWWSQDREGEERYLIERAGQYERKGDFDKARLIYEDRLEVARKSGDSERVWALYRLAQFWERRGHFVQASGFYEEQLTVALKSGGPTQIARALIDLGMFWARRGDFTQARQFSEKVIRIEGNTEGLRASWESSKEQAQLLKRGIAFLESSHNPKVWGGFEDEKWHKTALKGQRIQELQEEALVLITVSAFANLHPGMKLPGRVVKVVAFGAFIDIGSGLIGLVHISKLANHYVRLVEDVVHVGNQVTVWVEAVDRKRGRISLALVQRRQKAAPPSSPTQPSEVTEQRTRGREASLVQPTARLDAIADIDRIRPSTVAELTAKELRRHGERLTPEELLSQFGRMAEENLEQAEATLQGQVSLLAAHRVEEFSKLDIREHGDRLLELCRSGNCIAEAEIQHYLDRLQATDFQDIEYRSRADLAKIVSRFVVDSGFWFFCKDLKDHGRLKRLTNVTCDQPTSESRGSFRAWAGRTPCKWSDEGRKTKQSRFPPVIARTPQSGEKIIQVTEK